MGVNRNDSSRKQEVHDSLTDTRYRFVTIRKDHPEVNHWSVYLSARFSNNDTVMIRVKKKTLKEAKLLAVRRGASGKWRRLADKNGGWVEWRSVNGDGSCGVG